MNWILGLVALLAAALPLEVRAAPGAFLSTYLGSGDNDAVIGLTNSKTYLHAVKLNGGPVTVNGVTFAASSGGNPSTANWSIGIPLAHGGGGTLPGGALNSLVNQFIYGANPSVVALSNLTAGQIYTLTFYFRSWGAGNARFQNIGTTSGANALHDGDMQATAQGQANLLRYTFVASGATEVLWAKPVVAANSMHTYAFSTEQVFNKSWSSGGDWTTATWSPVGFPNSQGANANLPAQLAPTTLNLDANATVGHLQFVGANGWGISSSSGRMLTLQADLGGVSVLSTPTAGSSHTNSTAMIWGSDVIKTGDGTLTLSGAITDNGKTLTLGAGTLRVVNSGPQTLTGVINGSAALAKDGSGTLNLAGLNTIYSGPTTIGAGTLAIGSGTLAGAIGGGGALTKIGSGTLTLSGTENYGGATTISGGTLRLFPNASSVTIPNGTFETPVYGAGAWAYAPAGASWTFSANNSGVARNGSPWVATAPEGSQAGFVQNAGSITQTITVTVPGSYNFTFRAANRPTYSASHIHLLWDGVQIGLWPNTAINNSGIFGTFTVPNVVLTAGSHTLVFQASQVGADSATAIDNITITGNPGGILPVNTVVNIAASGAVLDTGGNNQTVGSLAGVVGSSVTNNGGLTVGGDNTSTLFAGVISGAGSVTKGGTGSLTLSGVNTYAGATTNKGGTLAGVVGGSCANSAFYLVPTNGAVLGVSIPDNTKQWTCSSLTISHTLNGGSSSTLDFNFGTVAPSTTVAPLKVNNAATFTTTPTVTVELTADNITMGGRYPLMAWSSTAGTAPSSVTVNVPDGRSTVAGHLVADATSLKLVIDSITSTQPLSWTGGNGIWDVNNSGNTIWQDNTPAATYFQNGDAVVFDNTTGSGGTVTLDSVATPSGVAVSNPTADYTISGSGAIAGSTTLTKSGAGKLTLATPNTHTGVNMISAGTVNLGVAENPGISGPLGNPVLPGSIAFGGGTLQYSAANQYDYSGRFSAAANQVYDVDTASQNVSWAAALTSSGGVLTKRGLGTLSMGGPSTYSGATTISGGSLRVANSVTVTTRTFTSDANSGIGTASPYGLAGYTHALAFNQGANVTINGLTFVNTGVANSGTGWSVANWGNRGATANFPAGFQVPAGQGTYTLLNHLYHGVGGAGYLQTLTLSGLAPGQAYIARIYYRTYGVTNTTSRFSNWGFDPGTGTTTAFLLNVNEDENLTGNILEFSYVAGASGTVNMYATNQMAGSWHLYGFSNQRIGTGAYLPNNTALNITAPGAALDLSGVNQTIGSLNGVAGSFVTNNGLLTVGGDNSDTEFAGVISDGPLTKTGTGKLTLSGLNTYTGETIFGGGIVEVTSLGNYGDASSLGARTLAQENTTFNGVSLHFRGGTLRYAGATPQSTDRHIRILNGTNATLDASGIVPTATMSFTRTGANMNLFDTGGTRTLTLTGSNPGPNTFSIRLENQGANATSLTKDGPGTWVLNAPDSTYTGVTTVSNGTLRIASGAALGGAAGNTTIPGGENVARVELTSGISTPEPFILGGRSGAAADAPQIANVSGNNTISGLLTASTNGDQYTIESQAGSLTLSGGFTAAGLSTTLYLKLQGAGSGLVSGNIINGVDSLVVSKSGSGSWTLAGTNTHTGSTLVNAGRLLGGTGGSCSNSLMTVASAATNGVQVLSAGGQWVCTNVTYSAGPTYVDFGFGLFTPSATVAPLLINGDLDCSASTPTVILRGASFPATAFPLLTYTGNLVGSMPTTAIVIGHASAALTQIDKTLWVTVTSTEPLTWLNGDGYWNLADLNWHDNLNNPTAYIDGTPGDLVVFDDTASGTSPITVTLDSVFSPASVTANLTNKNYIITGAGDIAGATGLTKTGSGLLTLAGTNTYTGLTFVQDGTFQLGNGADKNGSVAGNISNNAALIFANPNPQTYGGSISGTGGLTKNADGVLTLNNSNSYAGTTIIGAGTVKLGGSSLSSLRAYYQLENSVQDSSGNGLSGLAAGFPPYSSGQFGQAVVLNGINQYLTVPYSAALGLNAYTISIWVNVAVQPAFQNGPGPALVSTRNGGETTLDIQYTQNPAGTYKLHADIGNGLAWLSTVADFTFAAPLTGWNMITYAVSSAGYTIYTNGVQAVTGTFTTAGTPLFMKAGQELSFGSQKGGGANYGSAGFLNGSLDEIVLFGRVLTAPEIAALYAGTLGNPGGSYLPASTTVQMSGTGALDLNGVGQNIVSLSDSGGTGGTVSNSAVARPAALNLTAPSGSTTFSGSIVGNVPGSPISLSLSGGATRTLTGSALLAGVLNLENSAVLNLAGNNTLSGNVSVYQGTTLNLYGMNVFTNGAIYNNGTINITNDVTITSPGYFYVGLSAGSAGVVNQTGGLVTLGTNGHSLLLGNTVASSVGTYNLLGGTLNAPTNVTLGVNPFTGGILNVANGTFNAMGLLDVGRSDGTANTTNAFNQWGGVAQVGRLNIAASPTNICSFNITNASFSASAFTSLASGNGAIGHLVLGPGAQVVLPPFPTVRGAGAVADITFDGGTLSPSVASSNYLEGLTGAYLTANGAIFNVTGIVAVAQPLSNFGGDNGALTKIGPGVLALAGDNTYSGPSTVRSGGLYGVTGSSCSNSTVTVVATAGPATFGIVTTNTTKQWVCSGLTVNDAGGGCTLDFNFGAIALSPTVPPWVVLGTADFTTVPVVSVTSYLLASAGTFPLMTWGSMSGTAPTAVTIIGSPRLVGTTAHLEVVGNTLNLVVTAITTTQPVSWTGGNGIWDVNNAANLIWKDNTNGITYYMEYDTVVFDNTVGSGGSVTLNTGVTPLGVTVNNPSADYTIGGSGAISGSTTLSKSGAGKLTLLTTNTYSGLTTIADGTLQLGDGTATNGSVVGNITNNAALVFANPGAQSYGGVVSGTGSLTKTGTGTLALFGTNTYDGATTIDAGTLKLGSTLAPVATIQNFTSDASAGIGTTSPNGLSGYTHALAFNQGANVVINGVTFLNTGTASSGTGWSVSGFPNNAAAGSFPPGFPLSNTQGTYALLNHFYYGNSGVNQVLTITGLVPGQAYNARIYYRAWGLGDERGGTWTLNPGVGSPTSIYANQDLDADAHYVDFAYVAGASGTLTMNIVPGVNSWHLYGFSNQGIVGAAGGNLPVNTAVTLNASGTVLDLSGIAQTIGSLTGVAGSSVTNIGALTVGGNGSDTEFAGVMSGSGSLDKVGAGKLTLSAANTYFGTTTIRAGTLALSGSGGFANSTVITLDGGAALDASALASGLTITAAQTLRGTNAFNVLGTVTNLGTIELKLSKSGGVTTNDSVNGLTSITYGGTLRVTRSGDPLALTDTFKLFSAGSYYGAFASIVLPSPGLGLAWDTSTLVTDGTLRLRMSVTTLFSTGVDDSGALAADGAADLHFQLVASADPAYPGPQALVMTNNVWPVISGIYMTNGPISSWISPAPNGAVGNLAGDYTYRTTFVLDTLDFSTVRIEGKWASDNNGLDIKLNGVSLGISNVNGFASFVPFVISNGFVAGENTMEFVISNGPASGPTALRVEMIGLGLPYTATPPQIVNQPVNTTVQQGQNASFSVGAQGSGPLSYQWYYADAAGVPQFPWSDTDTNRVFTLSSVDPLWMGFYVVVVTNDYGSITSAPALLTVLVPVTGQVALEGYEGMNHDGVGTREVAFTATDGTTFTNRSVQSVVFAGGSGTYSINVPSLTTRFSAKTAWTLRQAVDGLDFVFTTPTPNFVLPGGDLDGSNLVDMIDYFALAAAWYQNVPLADIDDDGLVDLDDYFILANQWYQPGDDE